MTNMQLRRWRIADLAAPERWALNGGPFGSKLVSKMYVSAGVPVIRGCNLPKDALFDETELVFVSAQKADELRQHEARPGDLVITQRGTLGQVGLISQSARYRRYIVSQSQMKLTVDQQKADSLFLYYVFRSPQVSRRIEDLALRSGVPHINLAILRAFEVELPSVDQQRRIASILGAYDDLIEVNRRRIALLEEMARRLFEEWFVRFRFPGHEGHAMVVGPEGPLPESWAWRPMKAVCVQPNGIQTGPFGSQLHQSDYAEDGVPVVMPKNIIDLRIVEDDIARISEEKANELGRHRMSAGDVVYGRRGDIGRRAYISTRENGWFCGTGCLRLRPDITQVSSRYFFDTLGLAATLGAIRGRAQGATMPNLSAGAMSDVPLMVPPLALQQRYEHFVEPLAASSATLQRANATLAASRDLLLPHLVSGDLSVSGVEQDLGAVA